MRRSKQNPLDQARISRILGSEIGGTVGPGIAGALAGYGRMKSEEKLAADLAESEACILVLEVLRGFGKDRQAAILEAAKVMCQ